MNHIQIGVVAFFVLIFGALIVRYMIDDVKQKKQLKKSFSTESELEVKEIAPVFEEPTQFNELGHNLLDIGADYDEELFSIIDNTDCPFLMDLNPELDILIDLVFKKPIKVKMLPSVAEFTGKPFAYFLLNADRQWVEYTVGQLQMVTGVRLAISLVNLDGVLTEAKIARMIKELLVFANKNNGALRHSYDADTYKALEKKYKLISPIAHKLDLFVITKDELDNIQLNDIATKLNLMSHENKFYLIKNDKVVFEVADEHGNPFSPDKKYNLLKLSLNLHLQKAPLDSFEELCSTVENMMELVELRLLTANKEIVDERLYKQLRSQVTSYVNQSQRKGVEFGDLAIYRIFEV